jgi:hypothetical protein
MSVKKTELAALETISSSFSTLPNLQATEGTSAVARFAPST